MRILITAGNTSVPIDRVRVISNIATGRTGAKIASCALAHGHDVVLITSNPELARSLCPLSDSRSSLLEFTTFDDLQFLLQQELHLRPPHVVIHSAAVSDYRPAGIFKPAERTRFDSSRQTWESLDFEQPPAMVDLSSGKIKSTEPEIWIRLVQTPKLIQCIRQEWNYAGMLVAFKLEVGLTEEELTTVAERARWETTADLMIANTLEDAGRWALIGPVNGLYERVDRDGLPERLLTLIESMHRER